MSDRNGRKPSNAPSTPSYRVPQKPMWRPPTGPKLGQLPHTTYGKPARRSPTNRHRPPRG